MQEEPSLNVLTLKQRVYLFSNNHNPKIINKQEQELASNRSNLITSRHSSRLGSSLNPRIPYKKLKEHSNFNKSIEKKKSRTIDVIKNSSLIEYPSYQTKLTEPLKKLKANQEQRNFQSEPKMKFQLIKVKRIKQTLKKMSYVNISLMMLLKHRRPSALSTTREYSKIRLSAPKD